MSAPRERKSYALGVTVARELQRRGIRLDSDGIDAALVAQAVRDTLVNDKPLMSTAEVLATSYALTTELQQRRVQDMEKATQLRRKLFEQFLADNAERDSVVTLPSGLQYEVLRVGTGRHPATADTVRCVWRATSIDGEELDSSQRPGRPTLFKVYDAVPAWREALSLMREGAKWRLVVPAELNDLRLRSANSDQPVIYEIELVLVTTDVSIATELLK